MKLIAYNDKLEESKEFGSFTVVARQLNKEFKKRGVLGNINDPDCVVIYPEVFATEQRWKKQVPYLACEYSLAPKIVIDKLKLYNPLVLAISEFAKQNILNSGYDKVETVYLGVDSETWYPTQNKNKNPFTYLTVNSSNERSGLEKLLPAFHKFSKNKNVKLIIKDGVNLEFEKYVNSFQNSQIEYIGKIMLEDQLRDLYSQSNLFLYTNHTTSFGMTPLEAVLCGTPAIVTLGSALKEFIPGSTQLYKIYTKSKQLDKISIQNWTEYGISCFPDYFLNLFDGEIYGERVDEIDIYNALEFSFINYDNYLIIQKEHKKQILQNFTWKNTVSNIISTLKKYDYFTS
jgi:glycosyltransferase involved in cell wall biosynthesis